MPEVKEIKKEEPEVEDIIDVSEIEYCMYWITIAVPYGAIRLSSNIPMVNVLYYCKAIISEASSYFPPHSGLAIPSRV